MSLSGDGGDELFAGYNRHAWLDRVWGKAALVPAGARRTCRLRSGQCSARRRSSGPPAPRALLPAGWQVRNPSTKVAKLARVLAASDPEDAYRALTTHWDDAPSLVLGNDQGDAADDRSRSPVSDGGITEQMLWSDLVGYLPDDILAKLDRAAMAVSLETRVPFLDRADPRSGLEAAARCQAARRPDQVGAAPSARAPRAGGARRATEDGLRPAHRLVAPRCARALGEHLLDERRLRDQGLLDPVPDSTGLGPPPHGPTGPGLRAVGRAGPAVLDGSVDAVPRRGVPGQRLDRRGQESAKRWSLSRHANCDGVARCRSPPRTMASRDRDPDVPCAVAVVDEQQGGRTGVQESLSARRGFALRTHRAGFVAAFATKVCASPQSLRRCCPKRSCRDASMTKRKC